MFFVALSAHWIRGALYIIVILVAWYFLKPIVPALMEVTGNENAIATFVVFTLFGPLVFGWVGQTLVNPLARKILRIDGASKWEDRLVRELAPDSNRGFPVVLVPWPSATVRTFALLTDTYDRPDGEGRLASVYIPGTPNPSAGSLRVVPDDKLVYTTWSMRDLLRYHATYGATGPARLADGRPDTGDE